MSDRSCQLLEESNPSARDNSGQPAQEREQRRGLNKDRDLAVTCATAPPRMEPEHQGIRYGEAEQADLGKERRILGIGDGAGAEQQEPRHCGGDEADSSDPHQWRRKVTDGMRPESP